MKAVIGSSKRATSAGFAAVPLSPA